MILVNGQAETVVSALDRGLHYGDGLFETLAVEQGRPKLWPLHWARFKVGCQRLNLALPDEQMVLGEIQTVAEQYPQAVVKLILTRGSGGRGYRYLDCEPNRLVFSYSWPEYRTENQTGIGLYLCETRLGKQPQLAGIKHLNRLPNVLARNEWTGEQFAEGLMLSENDWVVEGTMSNIFFAKDGELYTPDVEQCGVAGVMRQHILHRAAEQNREVTIGQFQLVDIYQADELFVCNSIIGIWPVREFNGRRFDVSEAGNPLTRQLQQEIRYTS